MKIKTDFSDELEVPEVIMSEIKAEWEEYKANHSDPTNYSDFDELVNDRAVITIEVVEKVYDYLGRADGKIVDKDLAIFLSNYVTSVEFTNGGYPIDKSFNFEDNGKKYTILAFGWNSGDKNDPIYMIGYKE